MAAVCACACVGRDALTLLRSDTSRQPPAACLAKLAWRGAHRQGVRGDVAAFAQARGAMASAVRAGAWAAVAARGAARSRRGVSTLGVVGAGQMGGGIAWVGAVRAGLRVVLVDSQAAALDRNAALSNALLQKEVAKGRLTAQQADEARSRISTSTDMSALREAEFVVEAAPENFELKRAIFMQLDKIVAPSTVLATNTSSISITRFQHASVTSRPDKVRRVCTRADANVRSGSAAGDWDALHEPGARDEAGSRGAARRCTSAGVQLPPRARRWRSFPACARRRRRWPPRSRCASGWTRPPRQTPPLPHPPCARRPCSCACRAVFLRTCPGSSPTAC